MGDIDFKISICPSCGRKLIKLNNDRINYICTDSSCRIKITKSNCIDRADLYEYAKLTDSIEITSDKNCDAYMLLKKDLSGPMMLKNTDNALDNKKNTYCILKAKSLDDAIEQFQSKFKVIKVTKDMVVPINISEV